MGRFRPASRWTGVGRWRGIAQRRSLRQSRQICIASMAAAPSRPARRCFLNPSCHGHPGPARCWPRRRRFCCGTLKHNGLPIADRRGGLRSPERPHCPPRGGDKGRPRRRCAKRTHRIFRGSTRKRLRRPASRWTGVRRQCWVAQRRPRPPGTASASRQLPQPRPCRHDSARSIPSLHGHPGPAGRWNRDCLGKRDRVRFSDGRWDRPDAPTAGRQGWVLAHSGEFTLRASRSTGR